MEEKHGANVIDEIKPASAIELILDGVREPMMLVLLSIGALSLIFGKIEEAIVMAFVVASYIAVEFINKYRTNRTMTKLRQLTSPTAKIIRNEKIQEIPTADVTVGDTLILTEGVRISADAQLIENYGLLINEASLTGESLPVKKDTHLDKPANLVFSGTTVMSGEGKAVVYAIGRASEFGKIAHAVATTTKERTVLQETMTRLAKVLAIFALIVSILIPAVGFLRGLNLQTMIVTWLALTFLMIPGQPPIIITMALALASFRLAKIKLIVKRLRGVEVLGQVTVIVTDKTGTITEDRMQVEKFILPNGEERVPTQLSPEIKRDILLALPQYSNDPTDIAVQLATKNSTGIPKPISFAGFSEEKPWRVIGYEIDGKHVEYTAGKAELLIKNELQQLLKKEVAKGKRVVAYSRDSELIALAVLSDPIRSGVAETIAKLKTAKIETFIVTGDHPITTEVIAKEVGIDTQVLTGANLEKMSDNELKASLESVRIFARISPSQKLRIVEMLRQRGEVVAVVGDGINDAPALKAADVGIAMGEIGTDLAKETADLILTDDNYAHLADAIGTARSALDNFRKGITYYLTAKAILLAIFLVPLAIGIPFPFAPIYIILTELLMDLASSTIFVTEAVAPDIMQQPFKKLKEFLGKKLVLNIIRNGIPLAVSISALYMTLYFTTGNLVLAQTTAFVTWLLGHILLALSLRQRPLLSNRFGTFWLLGMIIFSIAITSIPILRAYLGTSTLSLGIWAIVIGAVTLSTFAIKLIKCDN